MSTASSLGATGRRTPRRQQQPNVRAVERAFRLLEMIADCGRPVNAVELATAADMPHQSASRLLRTLADRGYVRHSTVQPGYTIGLPMTRLSEAARKQIGANAQPELNALAAELGETVGVAVLSGDRALYLRQEAGRRSLRTAVSSGHSMHAHASAAGKAILAQLGHDEIHTLLARTGTPRLTTATITDQQALLVELAKTRLRGHAIDNQEQEAGMICYAVPIPHAPSRAALAVSGPDVRLDGSFAVHAIPLMRDAAERIAGDLAAPQRTLLQTSLRPSAATRI